MRKRIDKEETPEADLNEIIDANPLEEDQEVFEEAEDLDEPAVPGEVDLVETPEAAVVRLSGELDEQKEQYLRLAAELDNFRKRVEKQRSELRQTARAEIVRAFIDTLDDVARVTGLDTDGTSTADVIAGVQMVEKNLKRALENAGLESLGAVDQRFDPNDHEAVAALPAPSEDKEDRIAAVFQIGYRFGTTLLRPARVQVYVAASDDEATGE